MYVGRFSLAALVVLVAVVFPDLAAQPETWGPVWDGVRLGMAVRSGPSAAIQISAQNVSDTPVLLPFGSLIGAGFYDFAFSVVVTTPDRKDHKVIYTGSPGAIGGRIDPLVIALAPKASYTAQIPLALFYVLDTSEKLDTYISKPCRLRVELNVEQAICPLYGYPNPNMIPCWQGKLVSNTLQLAN